MAKYRITGPDGTAYVITAPDNATQADVLSFFQQNGGKSKAAKEIENDAISRAAKNPAGELSGFDQFRAGVGKAFTDLARGAGQWVGAVDRKDVADSRARDASLMQTGAGTAGNIAGNLAMFAPTAMIPGANTVTGGALVGAAAGALQPSVSTGETLGNVTLGGIMGGAVPLVSRMLNTARATAEPLTQRGRDAIVGRTLNKAAGQDAAQVAARLQEAGTPFVGPSQGVQRTIMGEYVPGSIPTVGQAAENAGVAALERAAVANNPAVTNDVARTMAGQNAARVNVLDDLAGADGRRLFMEEARDATAEQLYGAARRAGVDPAALTPEAQANIAQFAQRLPPEVVNYAQRLARISGEQMDNATSVTGLHWVKKALDGLIGQAQRSGDNTLVRAYTGLQRDLLTGIDQMSPAYAAARGTYREMSRPINQMEVGAAIRQAAVDPLTGNIRPGNFARAVSDQTAARATGLPTATLEATMEPAQTNALQSILLDLRRANAAQNVGRGPGSDTVQKLAYTNLMDQAGVPTFIRNLGAAQVAGNLAGQAGNVVYSRANQQLANRLAEVMLDPAEAATLMLLQPPQGNALTNLLARSASGAALSAPAIANAQK